MSPADTEELKALLQIAVQVERRRIAQCAGKFAFPSQQQAIRTISDRLKEHHCHAYRCRLCGCWHIGQAMGQKVKPQPKHHGYLRMSRRA